MELPELKLTDFVVNPKVKNKVLNTVIILAALIIAFNIYQAQLKNTTSLQERKDTELKKNKLLGDISQLEKWVNSYRQFLGKKDMSFMINNITNLAKDSGVNVVSFKPLEGRNFPLYVKYPLELILEAADYHSIGEFISKLESHPDIYIMEAVDVLRQKVKPDERATAKGKAAKLKVTLRLSTVLFKFD